MRPYEEIALVVVWAYVAYQIGELVILAWRSKPPVKPSAGDLTLGREGLAGLTAVVERASKEDPDRIKVRVKGELWNARLASGGPQGASPGTPVRVREVKGLELEVEALGEVDGSPPV